MTGFQIVMILLGGGFALSAVWPNIKALLAQSNEVKKQIESIPKITPQNIVDHPDCDDLVCIVKCWEELKESCESKGLTSAKEELEKIFPLFIVRGEKNGQ